MCHLHFCLFFRLHFLTPEVAHNCFVQVAISKMRNLLTYFCYTFQIRLIYKACVFLALVYFLTVALFDRLKLHIIILCNWPYLKCATCQFFLHISIMTNWGTICLLLLWLCTSFSFWELDFALLFFGNVQVRYTKKCNRGCYMHFFFDCVQVALL